MGLNPKKADQSLKQAPPLTSFAGPLCGAVDFCHWAGGGDKESGREASSQINTAIHNNGARVCVTLCTFVYEGVRLREERGKGEVAHIQSHFFSSYCRTIYSLMT